MHFAITVSYPELGRLQSFLQVFHSHMDCLSSLRVATFLYVCIYVYECVCSCHPGTKENLMASKILLDMWPKVESDADKHAVFLLR